jgi:hypothetical protein
MMVSYFIQVMNGMDVWLASLAQECFSLIAER